MTTTSQASQTDNRFECVRARLEDDMVSELGVQYTC
jgi:hypothetical protein